MSGWNRRDTRQLVTTILCVAAVALIPVGCGFERATGNAMGTTYSIQADCSGSLPHDRIDAELARINALMSTYDRHSELSRFNRGPTGVAVTVSSELVAVVDAAFVVSEQTQGAFDATVAPLVALWGFGADAAQRVPGDDEVAQTLRSVDYRRVAHNRHPPTLEKRLPATLDLSGIAKGFAVDRVAGLLDDARCRSYLIEFGGEVRASGNPSGGGPWRVGVESPSGPDLREYPIAGERRIGDLRRLPAIPGNRWCAGVPYHRSAHRVPGSTSAGIGHGGRRDDDDGGCVRNRNACHGRSGSPPVRR